MIDADLRDARTPIHRALAKAAPQALADAMSAVEAIVIEVALSPRARRAVERLVVHQVAKAMGIKAAK